MMGLDASRRAPDTIPRLFQMLIIISEINDEQKVTIDTALHRIKAQVYRGGRRDYVAYFNEI
jgi:hypothetical protein